MSRYYLDTNILVYDILNRDELSSDVEDIMTDYTSIFYTSSLCILEILIAHKKDGLEGKQKKRIIRNERDILTRIEKLGIEIVPFNTKHLEKFCDLNLRIASNKKLHTDFHDLAIMAQSISDHIPIISSDKNFPFYEIDGLDLIFNKR